MRKLHTIIFISYCTIFLAKAEIEISLNGTVTDGDGDAIERAIVTLLSDTSLRDYTNSVGEFFIKTETSIKKNNIRYSSSQNHQNQH